MKKPVIAIDGYSSTGKSSISKKIARKLGLLHIDTGAMYRAITFYAITHCINDNKLIDFEKLIGELPNIHLQFLEKNNVLYLHMNGKELTNEIRSPKISEMVSMVAKEPKIRAFLLQIQHDLAEKGGVIMDGRDIGTVVLPNADFKFFLTASAEERARRRFTELENDGIKTDFLLVKENLINRDRIDSQRETAPLKMAKDAILIDNTEMNKEETIKKILSYIK